MVRLEGTIIVELSDEQAVSALEKTQQMSDYLERIFRDIKNKTKLNISFTGFKKT